MSMSMSMSSKWAALTRDFRRPLPASAEIGGALVAEEDARLRAWLNGTAATGSYMPAFGARQVREWPMYRVRAEAAETGQPLVSHYSFHVLTADGSRAECDALVRHELRPLLASATALLAARHAVAVVPPFSVVYVDAPERRYLPAERGAAILPDHINGGVCYHGAGTRRIVVFRREDAGKVLIHELIHLFDTELELPQTPEAAALERLLLARYSVAMVAPPRQRPHLGLEEICTEVLAYR
jgi:hypothetical protein